MNIEKAEKELVKLQKVKDKLLVEKRKVISDCAKGIRAVHIYDYKKAREKLRKARARLRKLERLIKDHPELRGSLTPCYQELVELECVIALTKGKDLPELDVPADAYLLGVLDALGEAKRRVMDLLIKGEYEEAEKLYREAERIYYTMEGFTFPGSIVNGFKHKQDVVKKVLEKLHSTLVETRLRRG